MQAAWFNLIVVLACSWAQAMVVDGTNSPYVVSTATTIDTLTVAANGVLQVNAALNVTYDMQVQNGGLVTIDPAVTSTLRLTVRGTLTFAPLGAIDLTAKGLPANKTIDPATGTVGGLPCGCGGSHFVIGGTGSRIPTFDEPIN